MRAIFISYRREDAEGQAGRLFDDLSSHFGEDSVFMDVAGIEPGRDFRRVIDEHVASCGVLLAIIGKSWLEAKDDAGLRRLDDPMDFVRLETASALKRDIPVVPVLVHGARMPRAEQLPEDLIELAYRNGVELTHARWDSDVQVLIKALSPYVASRQQGSAGTPGEAAPPATGDDEPAPAATPTPKKNTSTIVALSLAAIAAVASGFWAYRNSVENERAATEKAQAADANNVAQENARQAEAARLAAEKAKKAEADRLTRDRASQQAEADKLAADKAKLDAERRSLERAKAQAEANRLAEEKRQADRAAAEKLAADKAAEAARLAAARERQARTGWRSYDFPEPNGGLAVFRIMSDGNPACASYNASSCLWDVTYDQLDLSRLRPLVCGERHRAKWGVTGYEDPKHWCSIARRLRPDRSGQ